MKDQFIPYELAVKLKELGFDEKCLASFIKLSDGSMYCLTGETNSKVMQELNTQFKTSIFKVVTPLWQQAFDWFREEKDLVGTIYANASGYCFEIHNSSKKGGSHKYDSGITGPNESGCWDTFEEARQACLEKLIEIVSK